MSAYPCDIAAAIAVLQMVFLDYKRSPAFLGGAPYIYKYKALYAKSLYSRFLKRSGTVFGVTDSHTPPESRIQDS
jgi:hypothetical protein